MLNSEKEQRQKRILAGVKRWASYYRANPHRFAKDYLKLDLKLFQKILLFMMNRSFFIIYIAARGQGKSFLVAVFLSVRAILYPGSKLVIASGTRGQSINVLEKIQTELMPKSPYLRNEIKRVQISNMIACIDFHNGSFIKVVTAADTSRSNRANILIILLSSYAEMHSRNRAKSKEAK